MQHRDILSFTHIDLCHLNWAHPSLFFLMSVMLARTKAKRERLYLHLAVAPRSPRGTRSMTTTLQTCPQKNSRQRTENLLVKIVCAYHFLIEYRGVNICCPCCVVQTGPHNYSKLPTRSWYPACRPRAWTVHLKKMVKHFLLSLLHLLRKNEASVPGMMINPVRLKKFVLVLCVNDTFVIQKRCFFVF